MLFGRYRALKAKIYKLKNDNKTALKAIDEGLSMVRGVEELRIDEDQMTEYWL